MLATKRSWFKHQTAQKLLLDHTLGWKRATDHAALLWALWMRMGCSKHCVSADNNNALITVNIRFIEIPLSLLSSSVFKAEYVALSPLYLWHVWNKLQSSAVESWEQHADDERSHYGRFGGISADDYKYTRPPDTTAQVTLPSLCLPCVLQWELSGSFFFSANYVAPTDLQQQQKKSKLCAIEW